MKRIQSNCLLCLFLSVQVLSAQNARLVNTVDPENLQKATLECIYEFIRPSDQDNKIQESGEYILQIGSNQTSFFSYSTYRVDSAFISLNQYKIPVNQAFAVNQEYKRPSLERINIYRNHKEKKQLVYQGFVNERYGYTEPVKNIKWKVGKETKKILGYTCMRADGLFRGRQWTVWFASDIAVAEGPWKLYGLPGLILETSDSTGKFIFKALEVRKANSYIYKNKYMTYTDVSYADFRKIHLDYRTYPDKYLLKESMNNPMRHKKKYYPVLLECE